MYTLWKAKLQNKGESKMLRNKKTGVLAQIIKIKGLYYAECSDGDHTHGHKDRDELIATLKYWGFEET